MRMVTILRGDIDKGGRPWPAIEVFIAASNGKIRACLRQMHGERPRRMGQIPDCDNPQFMCPSRQARHVMPAACAIINLGQHQHGDLVTERFLHGFGCNQAQFVALAHGLDQPFGHIEIGRKIALIAKNDLAICHRQSGPKRLIKFQG